MVSGGTSPDVPCVTPCNSTVRSRVLRPRPPGNFPCLGSFLSALTAACLASRGRGARRALVVGNVSLINSHLPINVSVNRQVPVMDRFSNSLLINKLR
jgi:hypothetical protein